MDAATRRLFLSLLIAGCIACNGCGSDSGNGPGGNVALKLNVELETPSLASLVQVVTLTVRYAGAPFVIDTLNFEGGVITDTLSIVPGDSVTFVVRAYDAGSQLLFEGRDGPRRVQPGAMLTLDVLLRPTVLMLRAGPFVQEVDLFPPGTVAVNIDVYNVDSLFGAAFRLHYDTTVLDFSSAQEGDLLSGNPASNPTLAFVLKDSADFVAYAVTRLRQTGSTLPGASAGQSPGRLATFRFVKKGLGVSAVTIGPSAELSDREGRPIPGHTGLVRESATIRIVNGI